jgi:type I restriction enzyme, S subunit
MSDPANGDGTSGAQEEWVRAPLSRFLKPIVDVVNVDPDWTYPIVGVLNRGRGLLYREPVTGRSTAYKQLNRIGPGALVYSRLKAFEGAITVTPDELPESFASQEFPAFAFASDADPDFFRILTTTQGMWDALQGVSKGMGGRRERVKPADFLDIVMNIPPLPVQERIVGIIGAVDGQINALDNEANALDGVYRGFLLSLGRRYGEVKISEVVSGAFAGGTPSRGQPEFYGGDIPWLKSGEVENDSIVTASEFITEAGLQGSSAKMVPAGATVVAMYGQGDTKGRAGFVEAPVSTNQAVLALVPNESVVLPRFLLHAVRSKTGDLRHRAVGSSQPNLSKSLVLSQTIPMPDSLADQERALVAIDSVRATQAATRAGAARLREVRAGLLSGLLDRTIDIKPAELEV